MIELLLFTPVVLSILVFFLRMRIANIIATVLYAIISLVVSILLYLQPASFTEYFKVDQLNIIFLMVLSVLLTGVSINNIYFLKNDNETNIRQTYYTIGLLLFAASMMGVVLSTHLALLWVFVEATTLTSAYLIYYHRSESALEATWKYLFICSIGIAIAFIGITLLSMGLVETDSLFFEDLAKNAKNINPFWLKLSFPFILVGFGTKVGFAPVHAWLPDAHSESPSPVSALLSGTLLNAALLGIIRVNKIMTMADMGHYVSSLLILVGFCSLFVTAVYIGTVKNYKRMLAYSSIENMGIIAIGLGVGGAGLFAAILHLIAHSLTKASLFLTSGNILHNYYTKEIDEVRGMLKYDRTNGWLWMLSFI
ncbi:MAG: hydrogenase [Spirochaetes bacterium]|nr:hydrogenase [Spirochaetota bacterium]